MRAREPVEHARSSGADDDLDAAAIFFGSRPSHEPATFEAIDELDDAVMAEHQTVCEVGDSRSVRREASHRQEQLVLLRIQTGSARLSFGERKEQAQLVAELGQRPIFEIAHAGSHGITIYRCTIYFVDI